MSLTGDLFIAGRRVSSSRHFHAANPASGETLAPAFSAAAPEDVEGACAAAAAAFRLFAETDREVRARLLERIAEGVMTAGEELMERAAAETGLPLARLAGERGRTVGQLKLFAAEVRDGAWMGVRIDPAQPERTPLPRPDLRMRWRALGPVAIFGASNFPLAFSVAGGDTASALAAGCPVVVKGHPAHPGTSELVAAAIAGAVEEAGLPAGVFSLLSSADRAISRALVSDPRIKAVGFTGSRQGGLALMGAAAARPEPIPVYAEMSAVNPVILLPQALAARAEKLGEAFVASLTMGAGQFCTNPGLLFAIEGEGLDRFIQFAAAAASGALAQVMLTPGIHDAYVAGVKALADTPNVQTLARGADGVGPNCGSAALFSVTDEAFAAEEGVSREVFGAASVLVRCRDAAALMRALAGLEGQLTATIHMEPGDEDIARTLVPVLEDKAGRLIANGWPTGVEVSHAMVHGGPFPATSDSRTTSVGTQAIARFLRPVSYQAFPDSLLPAALRGDGPAGVLRRVDGAWMLD